MGNPRAIHGLAELRGLVGTTFGPSPAIVIDQPKVDAFAEATGDHQWIHLDQARAASTPFGGTIIHGYFVLSLVPRLLFDELIRIEGVHTILNYGLDKLRFPDVARVGSAISLEATLDAITPRPPGELATFSLTFRANGGSKPCCAAQILLLLLE